MRRMCRLGVSIILLALLVQPAWGQSVTRGPYLQQQTGQSIIVRWRTDVATDSKVRFGTDSAVLNLSSSDGVLTTEHTVLVNGLSAATQYFYSVGSSAATLAGDASYHFATAPVPGTAANTRVWVIGDSGTANNDARAVRDAFKTWTASQAADFMLMLGDNAYNDGTDAEYQNAVFNTYPEILRQLPVWSTLGNHDGHNADSGTQTGPYYDIFDFPTAAEAGGLASGTEAYYAFDYGNIHFVVLDSYDSNRTPGGNMLQWLESDLALNNKPWLIAIWHHPPYTKGSHNSDTEGRLIDMRQYALPILEAWGVDLVMTGHSHTYERSFLLDGHYGLSGTLDIGANILDIGDGSETGNGVYQKPDLVAAQNEGAVYAVAGSSGKVTTGKPLDHPAMFIALESLGSMVLDIAGNRMDVTFLDQNALVKDEFTIMKIPDFEAPLITGASAEDASHVLVNYSEKVDAGSAVDVANYAIAGLGISVVELLAGNTVVRLTTDVMIAGSHYVLTVNNVMDESGNTIAVDSQAEFDFNLQMTKSFQDGLAPDTSYNGTFDTYIREASASTNYGAATTLQVDGDEPSGSATDMSILLGWDISAIPANATVQSATVYLNILNISSGPYFCYGLLRSWEQLQATWNNALSASAWATAGAQGAADRDSLMLCTISAPATGPLTVNLNVDGVAMVQSWIDGSAPNYGMVIADSATSDGADFDSSESANAMNRPKLEIVYTVMVTPPQPPVAPSALSASAYSSTRIDLDWVDNAGDETGYKVERSPAGAGSWTEVVALAADTSLYSDTGLAAGIAFDYRVFAYNAVGESFRTATATATTFTIPRVLSFSGRSWTVKASAGPVGPGPNYFADTSDDVWVDGSGYLHLRIMFRDGVWHSSEVVGDDVLGFGTYTFTLGSRVDQLDRNTVVGLFTWDTSAPEFNYREIDIEFARWGDPLADNSQYVVQPWDTAGNTNRWETTLTGNDSTHGFTWEPDRVEFSSFQGSPPAAQIQSWTYTGPDVPPEGTSSGNARINFWLTGGNAPSDGQQAELVIKSFDFTPLPEQFIDYPANGQIAKSGTVNGSYTDTQTDNDVSQSIRERESGGKKQNRYSFLEHKWTFNVAPAAGFMFNLNAWSSGSADGDEFVFAWSTDDTTYTDFLTVNSTDPANVQLAMLPSTLSGPVYIRVRDTDRTSRNRDLDTVFIDHMYIHAENAQGSPPAAPSSLGAGALSASSIALDWIDNAADELGFELQRSTDQVNWTGLPNTGADVLSVTDTGLASSTTYHYRIRAFNLSGSSDWVGGASATTDAGPSPSDINLTLVGSKVRGKHVIELTWMGTTTANVDIHRDDGLLTTTVDEGGYTDNTSNKGGRSYTYQVCEAGTDSCSAVENIDF